MPSEIEVPILQILYPPEGSIPAAHVERVPAILQHISALATLAGDGQAPKRPRRVLDPDESAALNARIIELRETPLPGGLIRTWDQVSEALGWAISPLAARKRYAAAKKAEEEFRKLAEGHLVNPSEELPPGNPGDEPDELKPEVELSGDSEQSVSPHTEPPESKGVTIMVSTGADRIPVKAFQIEANTSESPESAPPGYQESSQIREPAPLTEAEIDAELILLRDTGLDNKEIRDAMLRQGVDFGLVELRHKLAVLARKSSSHPQTQPEGEDEYKIPPNCTRPELDAVMWRLWDHGRGKTPDEISDILCNHGYSYGTNSVERRLRQQGAKL